MQPVIRNLVLRQGADWSRPLYLRQTTADGDPVSLVGCTARMMIRKSIDGAVIATLTTENDGITIDGSEGKIQLQQTASDSATYDLSGMKEVTVLEYISASGRPLKGTGPTGIYDLEMVFPGGEVWSVLAGDFCIAREVTR